VLLLVLFLAIQVTARGGGRSSGGSYSSSSSYSYRSSSRSYYGGGGGGGDMPVWAIILIVVILVFVLICICFSMSDTSEQVGFKNMERQDSRYSRTFHYEGTIPCYLCLKKVKNSEWDSGEHRKYCAFNNQRELLSFPQPYESYCPNCNDKLRLWPAKGHPFYCDECPYGERDNLKRSTGNNRLNCFLCDFDCCVNCSTKERFQKTYPEARHLVDDKEGVSDVDIERMAAGMAAIQLLETETAHKDEENERIEKVCGEAESITSRKPDDGWKERMMDESAANNPSSEPTIKIPSPDNDVTQSYPYNPSPFLPTNPTAPTQPTSPFIIPPPTTDHQQGYPPPQPSYITNYNNTSNMGQTTPYSSHPTIGQSGTTQHPSLPYGITPYTQDTPTTTAEYTPSAPPLINRY